MAVNPYQVYPIYDVDYIQKYQGRKIGELPPHIFAISDNAYYFMRREKYDQCIIIRYPSYDFELGLLEGRVLNKGAWVATLLGTLLGPPRP